MNPYVLLFSAFGLVTACLVVLLIYRSRLTNQETDWIPLTEDDIEDRAIAKQQALEVKSHKLDWPIRASGAASVLLLLFIVGFWVYTGIANSP